MQSDVFREVKPWKKPVHRTKAQLAKAYLKLLHNIKIIAITGSVGKTLTQEAIKSVLSQKYKVSVGDLNLDPTFRIPQTILKTKPWDKYMVLEFGVEHPGDMDYYLSIVKPNIAVYTVIALTHLKYFKNTQGVFEEKSKLAKALKSDDYLLLNADDPYSQKLKDGSKAQIIFYGENIKTGVKISHFRQDLIGSKFRLHYQGQSASAQNKLIGEHQLTSAYAAATVGIIEGLTLKQIATGLSQLKPPAHRLNLISLKNFSIIDDTYNSSPQAAIESIKTLTEIGKGKRKIALFGEMKDLGSQSLDLHKQVGDFIAKTNISQLITIGVAAKTISEAAQKANFRGKIQNAANVKEAISLAKETYRKSVILIKGSRHTHLERIVAALQGKSTQINCYSCGRLK